jgi:uncharacterized cupredoxin-like copper-binding protein
MNNIWFAGGTLARRGWWLLVSGVLIGAVCASWGYPALAATVSQQAAIPVQISLGTAAGELKFMPAEFAFTAGKRYKLVLSNPSDVKHYFTAKDFADAVWTQKVEAGNVEIKGAIHELELKPEAQAEWVFVAMKPGNYNLRCTIAGHTEAGMTGNLVIR